MKSDIRFGIVGCGSIGKRHAQHIDNLAKLVAVCDIVEDRASELGQKYSCREFGSIEKMMDEGDGIDVISICTPNGLHAQHTIQALRAGKHVICEKPMAILPTDCQAMLLEMEKVGKKLFVVKQNRFNPPIVKVKEAIESGKLGRIFNVQLNCFWNRNNLYYEQSDWKGRLKLDGGILYTQFSHFIDLLYWFVGDVESAHCITRNFLHKDIIEFEDTGVVIVEFANKAIGTINFTVNSYKRNFEGSITLFGEKGTVKIGGQYLNTLEYQNIEGFEIVDVAESKAANDYGFYQGSMSNHDKVYENVIEVLSGNGRIATSAFEGLKTIEIIDKIYRAARGNGR